MNRATFCSLTFSTIALFCCNLPANAELLELFQTETDLVEVEPLTLELADFNEISESTSEIIPCNYQGAGNPCQCEACADPCDEGCCLSGYLQEFGMGLAQQGIMMDLDLTQFYQGVTSGGREQTFRYGGKMDYIFMLDGQKLFGCPGFITYMHAETRFGEDSNIDTGALSFANMNMIYPLPGENETAITQLLMMQMLNERFGLAAGKFNFLDLYTMIYPTSGRGVDGFMNMSMIAFPVFLRTTNLSFLGAGALSMRGKDVEGALLVYDTNNSSTTSGLDVLFNQGAVVLGLWRWFVDINGMEGSHLIMGNWSSRAYTSVDRSSWGFVPGEGIVTGTEDGSWALAYIYDQIIWQDCCNPKRHVRFKTQWGLTDGNPSPYRWSGNAAIQAFGVMKHRPLDSMGAGYFYDGLGSAFTDLVGTVTALEDIHGMEVYYNAALTKKFHLTTDLQVVQSAINAQDPAVVLGLRAKYDF